MKHYRGYVSTDIVGSTVEFQFDMPDDATEDEIREIALESMWECIEMKYEEVKDGDEND